MSRAPLSRLALTAGLAAGVGAAGLALAPSAVAVPALPAPVLADSTVELGDAIVLSGTGCFAQDGVEVAPEVYYVGPTSLFDGDTQARPDGTWTLELGTYVHTDPGTYELEVNCDYYTEAGDYPVVNVTILPRSAEQTPAPETPAPETTAPTGKIRGVEANTEGVASPDSGVATGDSATLGSRVVKVLTGFQPGEEVTVTLHSTPTEVGTFTADSAGTVTVEFELPAGTAVGSHTLVYEGNQGTYFQEAFTVAGAAAPASSLAYTGTSVALPLGLGAGAVVLGSGLLLASRRRSAGSAQS
jgi:hypothetical protein